MKIRFAQRTRTEVSAVAERSDEGTLTAQEDLGQQLEDGGKDERHHVAGDQDRFADVSGKQHTVVVADMVEVLGRMASAVVVALSVGTRPGPVVTVRGGGSLASVADTTLTGAGRVVHASRWKWVG